MTDPYHYVWTTAEDGRYWAYCYCAWTSPKTSVHVDAIKAGECHMREAQFPFIEAGNQTEFEVASEFIRCGLGHSQFDMHHDPDEGFTWTASAIDDNDTTVVLSYDYDERKIERWHARDGSTGAEFLVGDLATVVAAAVGVIKRAELLD